jgi:hypothetical protein
MHGVCVRVFVAAQIEPIPIAGGVGFVHVLLQQGWEAGVGAGRDCLACRRDVICCSLRCCCAMMRSPEMRPRRLSIRQGLVVTGVRCGMSVAALWLGRVSVVRGGEESGVYVSGEGVESCAAVV